MKKVTLCKQCNSEPRQNGSSRCQKCSIGFKAYKLDMLRLQSKIERQKTNGGKERYPEKGKN